MARIVFVQRIFREYPAYMAFATFLKQSGHSVAVVVTRGERDVIHAIQASQPDLVGFSPTAYDLDWCLKTAQAVKRTGLETILGGTLVAANHEVIREPAVDLVCRGEGEACLRRLLDLKDSGGMPVHSLTTVPNLVFEKEGQIICNPLADELSDLDRLGVSDHSIYENYSQIMKSATSIFTFMRGCKFHCTFCHNHVSQHLYGHKHFIIRRKSPELAIREIENTIELRRGKLRSVRLFDSTLLNDKGWAIEFLNLYKIRIKLPFVCYAHPSEIDLEIARILKESGCAEIGFSIESGSNFIRNKILWKGISQKQIFKAVESLKKHRIPFVTFNMIGTPTETWEDILETVEINQKIKPMLAWASLTQIYRGTHLEQIAKELNSGLCNVTTTIPVVNFRHHEWDKILPLLNAFPALVQFPLLGNIVFGKTVITLKIVWSVLGILCLFMQLKRPSLSTKDFFRHYIFEKGAGVGYY